MNSQRGQMILEAILLMTVFLGITIAIASYFKQNETLVRVVQGPWKNLSGMFQNGMWAPAPASMINHPAAHHRHISEKGEDAK